MIDYLPKFPWRFDKNTYEIRSAKNKLVEVIDIIEVMMGVDPVADFLIRNYEHDGLVEALRLALRQIIQGSVGTKINMWRNGRTFALEVALAMADSPERVLNQKPSGLSPTQEDAMKMK